MLYLAGQNTQSERAFQDFSNHTHILLLEIISSQALRQILPGHLLTCFYFDQLCELLDCHPPSPKDDLDLFPEC